MAFARLERLAWSSAAVADAYSRAFPAMTNGAALSLLRAAGAVGGDRLLDLACGPGTVARCALEQGLHPVLCDLSREMLTRARGERLGPTVEALADRLPFRTGRFDRVVSNFGLLHFPDPARAIAEAARVTRATGAVAFSVWGLDSVAFQAIPEAVRTLGLHVELPPGPEYFGFARAEAFTESLARAGLLSPRVTSARWMVELPSADALFLAFRDGTARTRALLGALAPADQDRVRAQVARSLEPYRTARGLRLPTTAVIGSGRVPAR